MNLEILKRPPPRSEADVKQFTTKNTKIAWVLLATAPISFAMAIAGVYFKLGPESVYPVGVIAGGVLAAMPAYFAWGTYMIARASLEFLKTGIYAEATITEVGSDRAGLTVTLEYVDRIGGKWKGRAVVFSALDENKVGDIIPVLYSPKKYARFVALTAAGLAHGKGIDPSKGKLWRFPNTWIILSITFFLFAIVSASDKLISSRRDVIDVDLNYPKSLERTRVDGYFPAWRGKLARVGPHLLLYPLVSYTYQYPEDRAAPKENSRLATVYVPVLPQEHPIAQLILQIPPNAKGERLLGPEYLQLLSQVDFHFAIDANFNFVRDIPKGAVLAPGFVSDPVVYGSNTATVKAIRARTKASGGDLLVLNPPNTSYLYPGICSFFALASLFIGLWRDRKEGKKALSA